jgi:hypothetical protein
MLPARPLHDIAPHEFLPEAHVQLLPTAAGVESEYLKQALAS